MTGRSIRGRVLAVACLLAAACAADPAGVTEVRSTTSFGMCMGYCKTELTLSPQGAALTREPWGRGAPSGLPAQRFESPLAPGEWEEIARLADAARIGDLPDVIGCPDCADGGAESLTIVDADGAKTITFDHGATIEEAAPVLEKVRALRERLTPRD